MNSELDKLFTAISENNLSLVKSLLTDLEDINVSYLHHKTPLHWAVECRNKAVVELLLVRGADVNIKDKYNDSTLHFASRYSDIEIVKLLVGNGADVNARGWGRSPLFSSLYNRDAEVVRYLLDVGADVNIKDKYDCSPLHIACRYNNIAPVQLLLERGADVNATNDNLQTPLHIAMVRDYCSSVACLLDWGASQDVDLSDQTDIVREVFQTHLVKLQFAKLPIKTDYEFDSEKFASFSKLCEKELQRLKEKGTGRHCLECVFSKYRDPAFVLNEELAKIVASPGLTDEFPIYGHLLKAWFRKARQRLDLLNEALCRVNFPLPEEIIKKILTYIDNEDLGNLIKACQID